MDHPRHQMDHDCHYRNMLHCMHTTMKNNLTVRMSRLKTYLLSTVSVDFGHARGLQFAPCDFQQFAGNLIVPSRQVIRYVGIPGIASRIALIRKN